MMEPQFNGSFLHHFVSLMVGGFAKTNGAKRRRRLNK
tara:strand:+ start:164 stop:274 length:111 start_codon:yes stop_codon:yes gene_type:complete